MESSTSLPAHQFRLDRDGYQLLDGSSRVRLEKQPMELLILLAERRGQLVTRDEIAATLWGDDVFVDTDRNINSIVRKLRLAFQDDPDQPRFLETVVGKGYRFIGPLEVLPGLPLYRKEFIGNLHLQFWHASLLQCSGSWPCAELGHRMLSRDKFARSPYCPLRMSRATHPRNTSLTA